MNGRWLLLLLLAVLAYPGLPRHSPPTGGRGRRMWSSRRRVRTRCEVHPALQITGVTAGVVIRDQVASTMMEIRLRNPGAVAAGGRTARPGSRQRGCPGILVPGARRGALGATAASG